MSWRCLEDACKIHWLTEPWNFLIIFGVVAIVTFLLAPKPRG
jgi:hypothetical protein